MHSYEHAMERLNNCIHDIGNWIYLSCLKLNGDKTEVLFIGNRQQLLKCTDAIQCRQNIGENYITSVTSVRKLGFYMDEKLSGDAHVRKVTAVSYANLLKISKTRKYLNEKSCELLINGLVTSELDYCDAA